MTARQKLMKELEGLPDPLLEKVVDLVRAFREEESGNGMAFASESTLGKDWLRPEEDEAWKDL